MPTSTVQVETTTGVDPVVSPSYSTAFGGARLRIRRFIRHLFGVLNAHPKGAVVRLGTAQASAIVTCAGVVADRTVTVNGSILTAKALNAFGTLTIDSGENLTANDAFTVGPTPGVQFVAKATRGSNTQFAIGVDADATAANIAAAVNAHPSLQGFVVASKDAARVVKFRAASAGTGGNAYVLTEDVDSGAGGAFAVSGAGTFSGGAAAAAAQFDMNGSNAQTAAALVAAVTASAVNLISKHVKASSSGAAVTLTARTKGHAGNAITLATSDGTELAITGGVSRLTGGTETEVTL